MSNGDYDPYSYRQITYDPWSQENYQLVGPPKLPEYDYFAPTVDYYSYGAPIFDPTTEGGYVPPESSYIPPISQTPYPYFEPSYQRPSIPTAPLYESAWWESLLDFNQPATQPTQSVQPSPSLTDPSYDWQAEYGFDPAARVMEGKPLDPDQVTISPSKLGLPSAPMYQDMPETLEYKKEGPIEWLGDVAKKGLDFIWDVGESFLKNLKVNIGDAPSQAPVFQYPSGTATSTESRQVYSEVTKLVAQGQTTGSAQSPLQTAGLAGLAESLGGIDPKILLIGGGVVLAYLYTKRR